MKQLLSLISVLTALFVFSCNQPLLTDLGPSSNGKALSAVQNNGALKVQGNRIVNQSGTAVQFKGMSFFWSQWSGAFWNAGAVNELADNWGATIVRAAMGVEMGGYLTNPAAEKARVITVVDAAIAKGLYVIIDWHDHNAITNKAASIAFFTEMAQKYGKTPNVLFEVFNEPDGEAWLDIKAYAEEVIGAIRGTGSNNIVIVGTPTWSQDVDQAANNPITKFTNIAYTLHYYAATHKQSLRDKASFALSKGIALVVTEFGTCEATGDGLVDKVESQKWFDFLDQNKISWMNWSLFDKQEAASALKPGTSTTGPWTTANLTDSGLFVFSAMKGTQNPDPTPTPPSGAGFKISGGKLLDANGNLFIMQGINHAHNWYKDKTNQFLIDAKAKKANTVRIVLSNGTRWSKDDVNTVKTIIANAKANKLIAILEVHDTTGFGEDGGATSLDQAANYWVEMQPALTGEEKYVIINIGNEPYGNNNTSGWTSATKSAIQKIRAAGLKHTLMVDAPNWGQDWSNTMQSQAQGVFDSDSLKNTIFSIHMYEVYSDGTKVQNYINSFASRGLPLVVGEFANSHKGAFVAAADIMRISKQLVNGYIGWSWSGNSGGVEALDMVNGFNASSPSSWGNMIFADLQSSTTCSVFNSSQNQAPNVNISSPANNSNIVPGASTQITANASDPDGTIANVEFYIGANLIGTDSSSPYAVAWTAPSVEGNYTIKAIAKDNLGFTNSHSITVIVKNEVPTNKAPIVSITSPVNGTTITPSSTVQINANASDPDGSVASVAFYAGTTLIGTDTSAPYSINWTAPSTDGVVALKAVAKDNLGLTSQTEISVTVKGTVIGAYKVVYSKNDWGSGFTATIKITNNGTSAINNWKLSFNFAGNQKITDNWSATWTQIGNAVTASPLSWNGSIAPNATIEIGFNANYSGANLDPSNFTLTY